jgi:DNA-binding XRE family transcriptional regulator
MKPRSERETFYMALGERLRLTRKTLGISEQEAAEAAGVSVRTYRKWEKGATAHCDFWTSATNGCVTQLVGVGRGTIPFRTPLSGRS